uniref:ABC transporter G family member 25 n=1 Tax=Aceria tosichella TaxID=561515 RepID=A0A6G1S913_9ACAR
MSSLSQGHLAIALDPIAESDNKDVKLTRYCPLESISLHTATAAEPVHSVASENHDAQAAMSVTNSSGSKTNKLLNKTLTVARCQNKDQSRKRRSSSNKLDGEKNSSSEQDFQIVWTDLSFKVGISKYNKLINTTFDCIKNTFDVSAYCVRSKQVKPAGQSSEHGSEKTSSAFDGELDKPGEKIHHSEDAGQPEPNNVDLISTKMVELGYEARVVFENLNGYIKSGELAAILGPSGAGKTSLLNALCGRTENYGGRIQLLGGGNKRMRLSIIPQKDYLIENLTVRENLIYSSRLLNPDKDFNHDANILRVVKMLNLSTCFKSVVANISGGEYKRVSIAQELLRQPDILVLDEPTSGLDSLNCKNLIGALHKLIEATREGLMKPIAIVMTIHQPDVDVFQMFDHIYCVARGGRVIYDGHPRDTLQVVRSQANQATDQRLASYLAGEGGSSSSSMVATINPANLLIEIASEVAYGQEPIERLTKYHAKKFEQLYGSLMADQVEDESNGGGIILRELRADSLETEHMDDTPFRMAPDVKATRAIQMSPDASFDETTSTTDRSSPTKSPLMMTNTSGHRKGHRSAGLSRDGRLVVKNDHSGLFWYHTGILAQRAFVATIRDPLMTVFSFMFYLSVPFILWTVYPSSIGNANGCPVNQRELDVVSMASNKTSDKLGGLQNEVFSTIESSMMFFLTTYAFSMCSVALAALAFPLNMHILLKEVRNGWYNLPTYVLAKTLANFPFEVMFPVFSFMLIYLLLGMPSSHYEWRLLSIALVMALMSMIGNTQGLLMGALFMNSVETAIFLSLASSLPQVLLSGLTARIKHMPWLLQKLSWASPYRCATDLIHMIRFGFNMCPCDARMDEYLRTTQPSFKDIPDSLKPSFVFYITNYSPTNPSDLYNISTVNHGGDNGTSLTQPGYYNTNESIAFESNYTTTNRFGEAMTQTDRVSGVDYSMLLNETERSELIRQIETREIDVFARFADIISRAFAFGRRLDNCSAVRSQALVTFDTPTDDRLYEIFAWMFFLLLLGKIILFIVVRQKIGSQI